MALARAHARVFCFRLSCIKAPIPLPSKNGQQFSVRARQMILSKTQLWRLLNKTMDYKIIQMQSCFWRQVAALNSNLRIIHTSSGVRLQLSRAEASLAKPGQEPELALLLACLSRLLALQETAGSLLQRPWAASTGLSDQCRGSSEAHATFLSKLRRNRQAPGSRSLQSWRALLSHSKLLLSAVRGCAKGEAIA